MASPIDVDIPFTTSPQDISMEPTTESPPSSMDESTDEPLVVPKGCGVGVFGYEGSPHGTLNGTIPIDPKVATVDTNCHVCLAKVCQSIS